MKNYARAPLHGQRRLRQIRYRRLLVAANSNSSRNATVAIEDVSDLQAGPFWAFPKKADLLLPAIAVLVTTAAIVAELAVLAPTTREGIRALTMLFS